MFNGLNLHNYSFSDIFIKDKNDVFKCGISTAPPTDWLFYDTMYTERFMRLPTEEDNWSGYEQASLLNKV